MRNKRLIFFWGVIIICFGCGKNTFQEPPPYVSEPYMEVEYDPCYSPDGSTIAYAMAESIGDSIGIYLVNSDGANKRLFLGSDGVSQLWSKPDWSPDGRWLLLNEVRSANIYKIRVPEGDSLTQLTFTGSNFFPAWSPDGKRIAWDTNYNDPVGANVIWIMDADGSNKKNICQQRVGERRMPDWNPITNEIVHMRYGDDDGTVWRGIAEMDTNGENVHHIFEISLTGSYPKVSPDGSKIAFSSQADGEWPRIWVVNSDGSNPIKLTETGGNFPCWSPDGNGIVYCNTGVDGRLWIMNADGSNKTQLTF